MDALKLPAEWTEVDGKNCFYDAGERGAAGRGGARQRESLTHTS